MNAPGGMHINQLAGALHIMHMDLGSWDNNPIALNKQNGY